MTGTAIDDGLPNPPGVLTTTWSKVSGPGTAAFGNTSATNATVTFDAAGTYVLRLTADDSQAQSASDVTITVMTPTLFQSWQLQYFMCVDCAQAAANVDSDGDGMNNFQEFQAGTDPTNSKSVFHITAVTAQGSDVQVTWTTVGGMSYVVQDASNYATNTFVDPRPLIFLPGNGESTTNYLDAGAVTNGPSRYYRVRLAPGQ